MNYHVTHRTVYEYSEPVTVSHHAARVKPRITDVQRRLSWTLHLQPNSRPKMRTDFYGNRVCFFSVQELHDRLEITAESEVSLTPGLPPEPLRSPAWEHVVEGLREPATPEALVAQQFVFESPHVRPMVDLAEFARPSFAKERPLLDAVQDLNHRIFAEFKFDPEATTVATPLEVILEKRRGVCQDFTHLMLGCLRSLGLSARYVSGYLRTYRAEEKPGKALVGADASHAWLSVFCPGYGWVDFDPTNDLLPSFEHITVAFGRDFADVSPVSGIITGGGEHRVQVAVTVVPR